MSRYLREVRAELRKVNWPNRKELVTYTVVVVVSVLVIAAFIGLVDLLFSQILAIIARLRG
ncbi:MAG: preprotein translocase subunit SecE [Firmicutes bacterium]|nr:preprotein translocase subunit SecE [Bacillota bacterium]